MTRTAIERTIVFADICKSTQLFEVYGDVRARSIIGHSLSVLMDLIGENGGVVIKTIGDEVMATFANPTDAVQAATEMHPAVKDDPLLVDVSLAIKIGLHVGEVLVEDDGDVYGDAVNVAARMVGLAKANQIIMTDDTLQQLPRHLRPQTRSLGPVTVRGKKEAIRIVECLWETDHENLTMIATSQYPKKRETIARLHIRYAGQGMHIRQDELPFSIGRGETNHLIVKKMDASRTHAHIEFRDGHFRLVDHSSNGTYLQVENGDKVFVHRDHIRLRQSGSINLGKEWTPEELIWYSREP